MIFEFAAQAFLNFRLQAFGAGFVLVSAMFSAVAPTPLTVRPLGTNQVELTLVSLETNAYYQMIVRSNSTDGHWIVLTSLLSGTNSTLAITEVVKRRERSLTTGVGFGIGIPTADLDLIDTFLWAIRRSRKGIEFAAIDNKPVHVVLLHLTPKGQYQKHLPLRAKFAKLIRLINFHEALKIAGDVDDIHAAIVEDWKLICSRTNFQTDSVFSRLTPENNANNHTKET